MGRAARRAVTPGPGDDPARGEQHGHRSAPAAGWDLVVRGAAQAQL